MTILTPANAFPNLAFPQHLSGQTNTVQSFTYPGAVWPKATGPAVLSYTQGFPNSDSLARSFNGANPDKIVGSSVTPINFNFNSTFSVGGWFQLSDPTPTQGLFGHLDPAASFKGWEILYNHGNVDPFEFFLINDIGNFAIAVTGGSPPSANTWFHYIATYSGSTLASGVNLYFNGAALTPTIRLDTLGSHTTTNSILPVLGSRTDNSIPFTGRAKDVAAWNTVLTPAQVAALASGARPTEIASGNLVFDWEMTGASPEPDQSGNGNNGTLTGTQVAYLGPSLRASTAYTGLAFPQHKSGQTNTVQNFLYPGAVQPKVAAFQVFWVVPFNQIVSGGRAT